MKASLIAGVAVLSLAACVGNIEEGGGRQSSMKGAPSPDTGQVPAGMHPPGKQPPDTQTPVQIPPGPGQNGACRESPPPVQPARRMTRDQYLATVRDLLGDM